MLNNQVESKLMSGLQNAAMRKLLLQKVFTKDQNYQ